MHLIYLLFSLLLSFAISEELSFNVYYNDIKAGHAFLSVQKYDIDKKEINFNLQSNRFIDVIYKLRESTNIVVSSNNFSINQISKKIQQGRRKKTYNGQFNYNTSLGFINNNKIILDKPVYDPIAIIYFLRSIKSVHSDPYAFNIISKNKIKEIEMQIINTEAIIVNNKEYECFVWGPKNIQHNNKLKNLDDIKIWISNDEMKLPIVIEKKAKFGTIKMELNVFH